MPESYRIPEVLSGIDISTIIQVVSKSGGSSSTSPFKIITTFYFSTVDIIHTADTTIATGIGIGMDHTYQ